MNYKLILELALYDKRSNYIYSCKIKQYQKKINGTHQKLSWHYHKIQRSEYPAIWSDLSRVNSNAAQICYVEIYLLASL